MDLHIYDLLFDQKSRKPRGNHIGIPKYKADKKSCYPFAVMIAHIILHLDICANPLLGIHMVMSIRFLKTTRVLNMDSLMGSTHLFNPRKAVYHVI